MKSRVVIFCFYNKDGIVEDYVCAVLNQLKTISKRIIIVINGNIEELEKQKLQKYSQEIILRENIGMDQGAYNDILRDYLKYEEAKNYDELIFCNDTFYGFFTPVEDIFCEMEGKNVHIWGLNIIDRILIKHIQSYFLVFQGDGIEAIYDYFINAKYPENYGEAVAFLETGLFKYIENKGLRYSTFTDIQCTDVYTNPYDCVVKYNLPIIKKKCMDRNMCSRYILQKTFDYVRAQKGYVYDLPTIEINDESNVLPKKLAKAAMTEEELLAWSGKGKFYIFGAGYMGQILYYTYFKDNDNFAGFVVSNTNNQVLKAYSYKDISPESRIIIGVGQDLQQEVYSLLPNTMDRLLIWEN